MSATFFQSTTAALIGGLTTLKRLVDTAASHAEAKEIDPQALLQARLFPDMFTFTRQVYAATDVARRSMDRLAGKEPKKLEEPEATFAALTQFVEESIQYIQAVDPKVIDASEVREFSAPFAKKLSVDFTGRSYVSRFALPNFLFHVVTAYNILRHNGVALGKHTYLGPFLAG